MEKTRILGLSFSWKRTLGITRAKQMIARETGIPTSKAGLDLKIGGIIMKTLLGKNEEVTLDYLN